MKKIIYTLLFASVLLMFVGCPNPTEQVKKLTPQEHNNKFSSQTPIDLSITSLPKEGDVYVFDCKKYEGKYVKITYSSSLPNLLLSFPNSTEHKTFGCYLDTQHDFISANDFTTNIVTENFGTAYIYFVNKKVDITKPDEYDVQKNGFIDDIFIYSYIEFIKK